MKSKINPVVSLLPFVFASHAQTVREFSDAFEVVNFYVAVIENDRLTDFG